MRNYIICSVYLLEENGMKILRKILGKAKIERITSQKISESCGINKWVERRREWDQHVTRMDAERLVKISRTIYLSEDLQDSLNEDGAT